MLNNPNPGFYARVFTTAFTKLNAVELAVYARNVAKMTALAVAYYATPTPTLAALLAQTAALETATQNALDGGKLLIALRNVEKANLVAMLKQLAAYVQSNCQESYEILISSGFDAVRAPTRVGVLPAPANPRMVPTGKSGEMLFRIDRVDNAANITVEYGTAPEGPFTVLPPATGSRVLITDLTPGTIYFARACANGSAGPGAYSDITMAMAV